MIPENPVVNDECYHSEGLVPNAEAGLFLAGNRCALAHCRFSAQAKQARCCGARDLGTLWTYVPAEPTTRSRSAHDAMVGYVPWVGIGFYFL